ncbi:TadE/TadG family type IV pilus assembly protein [Pelagibacterium luteolum]|uniref:TadE-like protein n=1 Tax=Pelagibacterium luteolum TaxID=440168 RepID=A0A1G7VN24_9HYPH|nr:TadE/TadG family type IV pilus assembly protein [Pelagibacterium luteolum]SDG60809.1 TadE-like protein [Pelagibacterium luteolum]
MPIRATSKTDESRRAGGLLRRFSRSERGVTVIEFAIVGPIFFAIIGATIETALTFFAAYALDTAVIDSSRSIKTGQPGFSHSASTYRTELCSQLYGIFDCDEIRISVREIADFRDFSATYPIDESGEWAFDQRYEGAAGGPIRGNTNVMVEAYYKWPTIFNIPGLHAGQTADGKRLLAAAHAFKTEPFTP